MAVGGIGTSAPQNISATPELFSAQAKKDTAVTGIPDNIYDPAASAYATKSPELVKDMGGKSGGFSPETAKNLAAYEKMSPEERSKAFDEMMDATDLMYSEPGRQTPMAAEMKKQLKATLAKAMHGGNTFVPETELLFNKVMPTYTDKMSPEQLQARQKQFEEQVATIEKVRGSLPKQG